MTQRMDSVELPSAEERPAAFLPTQSETWLIAHTKSRQEKAVVADMLRAGVRCYLPCVKELRTHGNRKRWVEIPLFPGYVFAAGGHELGVTILRMGRVASLLPVSDQDRLSAELQQIDSAIRSGAAISSSPYLKTGVRARVARGPLRGLEGVVESLESPSQIVLLVETLGRATAVEVNPGDVEPMT